MGSSGSRDIRRQDEEKKTHDERVALSGKDLDSLDSDWFEVLAICFN